MELTPAEIIEMLGLVKHPTCGFVTQTYASPDRVPVSVLPPGYTTARALGSALYFLVTPEAQIVLHRIRGDQIYHHYLGDPLEVLLLYPDGRGAVERVGADLRAGMRPQLFIPGRTFHMSRLPAGGRYALLGTSEWIGVEPSDVELGNTDELIRTYPAHAQQIRDFTAPSMDGRKLI